MNVKIAIHDHNLELAKEGIKSWKTQDSIKKDLLNFLNDLSLGKVNKGKKISEATQIKYMRVLRCPLEFMNKPLNKLELKDIENFEKALSSDVIKSWKKKPYSDAMKVDIRLALKILLRWKLGSTKADKLAGWLETKDKVKTPDYLKESEINKLYKACKNAQERFLIAVLFDTGARAEEFHNIRLEDIELPEKNGNFVKVTLKEEYSKTDGRVISLYWKNSLEAVSEYLAERKKEIKQNDPIYNGSYDNSRFFLKRLGLRTLGKHLHFHLFRHSSATYYASSLNRQQLCYRFGWKFSSNMPDVYISRAGMNNKELDEKFESTELGELKAKLSKEEFERKKQGEEVEELKKALAKVIDKSEEQVKITQPLLKFLKENSERLGLDKETINLSKRMAQELKPSQ